MPDRLSSFASLRMTAMHCTSASTDANHKRLMQDATQAAPKPLSMFTTVTLEAHELSMPRRAATPPKLAP